MNPILLRYSRFQARDFVTQRLTLPLILLLFAAALPVYLTIKNTPPGFMLTRQGELFARQIFSQSVTLYLPLGAFVGAVGVVSSDRQQGYFRFLFSKPVNLLVYYAQTYLLHAIVYVAVFGLIVWMFGAYTIHFSIHRSMESAALTFVLVGGVGLMLGALSRFDGGALIAMYVSSLMLHQLMAAPNGLKNGGLPDWLVFAAKGLPPVHKLDEIRNHLYAGEAIDVAHLWHVLGYGGAAAAAGFVLLRRLPLAR